MSKLRVLDLSRVLAGPYCTMLLADLGADVIKIERPGEGDETRTWGPPYVGGESTYFLSINRGKRSVALDLARPEAQEALSRLGRIDDSMLVIGLSAGRPHPLVVRAMKLARHRKAGTIAITDATLSEVAKLAQIRLYYSSNSPAYVRSHTALLSMIQALAYGVYSRDAEQYADRIKAFRLK